MSLRTQEAHSDEALDDEEATLTAADSGQRVKQRLGFHKIRGVEAFGEPTVSLTEQLPCFFLSALRVPQSAQARGRP